MTLLPDPNNPKQFAVTVYCPACGSNGEVVWERVGKERQLISLSPSFYERLSKTPPHPIELVCRKCGAAQNE
jgi:uncharacterized OB-fold protein